MPVFVMIIKEVLVVQGLKENTSMQKNEVQHVFLVGAKSLGMYGGMKHSSIS